MISCTCPHCRMTWTARPEQGGQPIACESCGKFMLVRTPGITEDKPIVWFRCSECRGPTYAPYSSRGMPLECPHAACKRIITIPHEQPAMVRTYCSNDRCRGVLYCFQADAGTRQNCPTCGVANEVPQQSSHFHEFNRQVKATYQNIATALSAPTTALFGWASACPACKKWSARVADGDEVIASEDGWGTRTEKVKHFDSLGRFTGHTEHQVRVPIARLTIRNYYYCKFCQHKWEGISSKTVYT